MAAKAVDEVSKTSNTSNSKPEQIDTNYLIQAAEGGIIGLEQAADALLAAYNMLGKDNGIYTDAQLNRKMRREARRLPELDETGFSEDTISYVEQLQIEELSELAELTPMQDICYKLHCNQLSLKETAAMLGLSYQVVSHHLSEAKLRIKRVCKEGRFAGWYKIYLSEVNRTGCKAQRT